MLIAITGCSGTGVSTVSTVWKKINNGLNVCSLDKVAHRFLNKLSVKKELEKELVINGISEMSTDEIRLLLREKAFSDPNVLLAINRILHPRLQRWVFFKANELKTKNTIFVLDAALIFELQLEKCFDYIVTVSDKQSRVIERLVKRDKITKDTVKNRWKNQLDLSDKRSRSHFVITNSGSMEELEIKADNFYKNVLQRMEGANGTQNA